jgi:predicted nucleotidyltransferase
MSANSSLEAALATAIEELDGASIPYMLIGGLALSAWALPRATLDVDLTLWVTAESRDRVCDFLSARFTARVARPREFVRKTGVLPAATDEGVRLDFIFAAFPFERTMIERAPLRQIGRVAVRVARLEDLILLKLPSPRPRDQEDVRLILSTYKNTLEWDYLLSAADLLAETLDQPALAARLREYQPPAHG